MHLASDLRFRPTPLPIPTFDGGSYILELLTAWEKTWTPYI